MRAICFKSMPNYRMKGIQPIKFKGTAMAKNSSFQLHQNKKSIPYCLFYDTLGSYVPYHWHREVELILCKKGRVNMIIDNKPYEVTEGDIVIIPDGSSHLYMASECNERLVILFGYKLFEKGDNFLGVNAQELHKKLINIPYSSREWSTADYKRIRTLIDELEELRYSDVFAWDLAVRARIFDLIFYLCNYVEPAGSKNIKTENLDMIIKLDDFFAYIEENYKKPLSLQQAAEAFNFSPGYFARFFKKYSGQTFLSYLNAYRINKARDLLLAGSDMTIVEISETVGINNVKTFNRLFKQINGVSPGQYCKSSIVLK